MKVKLCDKNACSGCSACVNVCPKDALTMAYDAEGFLRPVCDDSLCVECGLCAQSCPELHPIVRNPKPEVFYASWHRDDSIRKASTSGGMFSLFAQDVFNDGGVVFGAVFDDKMIVRHAAADSEDGLKRIRGTKYLQSEIGLVFRDIRRLLTEGKRVLFVGTACQVAGLYAFLGKKRDDALLTTCDLVCAGVASPGVFKRYKEYLEERYHSEITAINFRDKKRTWLFPCNHISFANGRELFPKEEDNWFLTGFYRRIYNRPCCSQCRYANAQRPADLTLADCWRKPDAPPFNYRVENGVSAVLANSAKGEEMIKRTQEKGFYDKRDFNELKQPFLIASKPGNPKRDEFFRDFESQEIPYIIKKYFTRPFLLRLRSRIAAFLPVHWMGKIIGFLRRRSS